MDKVYPCTVSTVRIQHWILLIDVWYYCSLRFYVGEVVERNPIFRIRSVTVDLIDEICIEYYKYIHIILGATCGSLHIV